MPSRAARRCAGITALLLSCATLTLATGPSARASLSGTATAEASGVRTTYSLPGFLVVSTPLDDGGPITQAVLSTSGDSSSYASFPYPSDTVVNAGALADVATGVNLPYSYPLFVNATNPFTPSAHAQDATGSVLLDAAADDSSSTAAARVNSQADSTINTTGTASTSDVETAADGTITATADSITRGLDLGVLKIGEIHTHSVTVLKPSDSAPTTTSSTDVTGASVAGVAVTIGDDGLSIGGSSLGAAYAPIVATLNSALSQAGIAIALLGKVDQPGGTSQSGLQITQSATIPVAGNPQGTSTTVIGNATTFILTGGGSSFSPIGGGDVTVPVVTGGSTPPVKPAGSSPVPAASSTPPASTLAAPPAGDGGGGLALPPVSVPGADAGAPAPDVATPGDGSSTGAAPVSAALPLAADLSSPFGFFYLIIALGAGLAFLGSLFWRAKGVRALWIS